MDAAGEAAVGQRLKGAGMRWRAARADAACHLRALFKSEPARWETFGHPRAAA